MEDRRLDACQRRALASRFDVYLVSWERLVSCLLRSSGCGQLGAIGVVSMRVEPYDCALRALSYQGLLKSTEQRYFQASGVVQTYPTM